MKKKLLTKSLKKCIYSTIPTFIEKNTDVSGLAQLKPMLFKGQLDKIYNFKFHLI